MKFKLFAAITALTFVLCGCGNSGEIPQNDSAEKITETSAIETTATEVSETSVSSETVLSSLVSDTETAEATKTTVSDLPEWCSAYERYIRYVVEDEDFTYNLVYLDDDDIPELFVSSEYEAGGEMLVSYYDGKTEYYHISRLGARYIERSGLFYANNGHMGVYPVIIGKLENGKFSVIGNGLHEVYWNDEPETERYVWENDEVSAEEFEENIDRLFDREQSVCFDARTYSKEEILSVLRTGHHTSYGHRYELICADVSWDEARELCMEKGGYLATITSPAEQDIVQKQIEDENLQEISFYVGYRRAEWVGDEFMEPRWINADESFTSADHMHGFWKYSVPEYDYEQSQWEDTVCGLIKYVGGIYLFDAPDNLVEVSPEYSGKMGYICEFDD